MLKLINSGYSGYMGRVVSAIAEADADASIVAGVDVVETKNTPFPTFTDISQLANAGIEADVVIDFSAPKALGGLLEYALVNKAPLVLCTTGYSSEQLAEIEAASKGAAIFRSGNMSVGINLLIDLIERAAAVLGEDFDVEIVERHHRRKVDAPSGTALMLADAAAGALPYDAQYVYERESKRQPRDKREIGISSVRGGTIVGAHDVIFAGLDEVVELKHTAASRDVFAAGALKAAKFMKGKSAGMYDMRDVLRA